MLNPLMHDMPMSVMPRFTDKSASYWRHLKNTGRLRTYRIDGTVFVEAGEVQRLVDAGAVKVVRP
jgi:hypothetical protein